MTGPRAAAAAAPEPRCRGCRHPRRTRRGSSGPAGGSPLCGAGLRRRPRLRASGGARARGWAPWRRGCVPGNRRPAAAAAPCARPACFPAWQARPAPRAPMPGPSRTPRSPAPRPPPRAPPRPPSPRLPQWEAGRHPGCSPSGLRRSAGEPGCRLGHRGPVSRTRGEAGPAGRAMVLVPESFGGNW